MFWLIWISLFLAVTYCFYWISFYNPENRHQQAVRLKRGPNYRREVLLDREMSQVAYEQVWIISRDGLRLSGKYYHVRDGGCLHIQFHGYRGSGLRDLSAGNHVARSLGYNTLVVDQRAHGLSQGNTITFGIMERWDCVSWANYAAERFGKTVPIFLYGVSMGGASVLMASDLPLPENVVGIIADCPYTNPAAIIRKICRDIHIPGMIAVPFSTVAALIWGKFWLFAAGADSAVKKTKIPVLLIHGKEDKYILTDMSRQIQECCKSECFLELFPGAAHAGSCLTDTVRYRHILDAFVTYCTDK